MERLGEKPGRAEVLSGWLYHDRCLEQGVREAGEAVLRPFGLNICCPFVSAGT